MTQEMTEFTQVQHDNSSMRILAEIVFGIRIEISFVNAL